MVSFWHSTRHRSETAATRRQSRERNRTKSRSADGERGLPSNTPLFSATQSGRGSAAAGASNKARADRSLSRPTTSTKRGVLRLVPAASILVQTHGDARPPRRQEARQKRHGRREAMGDQPATDFPRDRGCGRR